MPYRSVPIATMTDAKPGSVFRERLKLPLSRIASLKNDLVPLNRS
jgi:hypothetical protein